MTILRQLIEGMIGDYLNESYEDDLVESIFEEVSEETWEAIEEAILNELSPKTLASYTKKSADDIAGIQRDITRGGTNSPEYKGLSRMRRNRKKGISRAVDRLAK